MQMIESPVWKYVCSQVSSLIKTSPTRFQLSVHSSRVVCWTMKVCTWAVHKLAGNPYSCLPCSNFVMKLYLKQTTKNLLTTASSAFMSHLFSPSTWLYCFHMRSAHFTGYCFMRALSSSERVENLCHPQLCSHTQEVWNSLLVLLWALTI